MEAVAHRMFTTNMASNCVTLEQFHDKLDTLLLKTFEAARSGPISQEATAQAAIELTDAGTDILESISLLRGIDLSRSQQAAEIERLQAEILSARGRVLDLKSKLIERIKDIDDRANNVRCDLVFPPCMRFTSLSKRCIDT